MAQSNFTTLNNLVFPFKNYILALPGWYPTWVNPLPGDFNQRHILAASLHTPQIVLFINKDVSGTVKKTEVRYNQLSKQVIEVIELYPKSRVEFIDPVKSGIYFLNLLRKYATLIKRRWGPPVLMHSYIVVKGGVEGLILSKRWGLPFILTENWTIYYPNDPGYLSKRGKGFKWAVHRVFGGVKYFLPVTNDLYSKTAKLLKKVPYTVVPNVVDTETFFLNEKTASNNFRFVHVSTMIYQKNPHGLLRGFKAVMDAHPQATLLMVGPHPAEVKDYAAALGFTEKNVRFTGAVPYKKVAEFLMNADALVLFSRYENLPCVILEALCCGVPVISTSVGGIAEVIANDNGILVEESNEVQLIEALGKMITGYSDFDREKISEEAVAKYSYEAVGKQIYSVYQKVGGLE